MVLVRKVLMFGHEAHEVRVFGPPADIDDHGQVATEAERVGWPEEEEEPVAAKEILNVVLRRHEYGVEACLLEEFVEPV